MATSKKETFEPILNLKRLAGKLKSSNAYQRVRWFFSGNHVFTDVALIDDMIATATKEHDKLIKFLEKKKSEL